MINPNLDLSRLIKARRNTLDAQYDAVDHNAESGNYVFDFGRWFFFCQRCKHGGHASCTDEWFASSSSQISDPTIKLNVNTDDSTDVAVSLQSRRICGVNGCHCECIIYGY